MTPDLYDLNKSLLPKRRWQGFMIANFTVMAWLLAEVEPFPDWMSLAFLFLVVVLVVVAADESLRRAARNGYERGRKAAE